VLLERVLWEPKGNASEAAMIKLTQKLMQPMFGMADVDVFRKRNMKLFDIPFNSKFKWQVHVHQSQDNRGPVKVYMKGAPERISNRCNGVMLGGVNVDMTPEIFDAIDALQSRMGANGLRVLGFAERELDPARFPAGYVFDDGRECNPPTSTPNFPMGDFDGGDAMAAFEKGAGKVNPVNPISKEGLVFLGLMALIDPPRPAVPGAVTKCKTAGIRVIMVTGDHPMTAKAIAHKVGILWGPDEADIIYANQENNSSPGDIDWVDPKSAQAIVVPGNTIDVSMGDARWNAILKFPQVVFARTSPQQKLVIVSNCQRLGHIVAVTGDGVNDSPAIVKADIGVAMGISGTPVTQNAADMILLDDNFASIVAGVEEGRLIFDNLKKSICYTLTSNIPEISPFLCFILLRTPLPLSTILILAIDLGTDMVPAISMAYEEAEADIMRRPPRDAVLDRLVTRKLICFAYLQVGVMQAMAGFFAFILILNDYGFPPHILPFIDSADQWGSSAMYCRFSGGYYTNPDGLIDTKRDPTEDPPSKKFPLWDGGDSGYLIDCEFPVQNLKGGKGCKGGQNGIDPEVASDHVYDETCSENMVTIESIAAMEASNYHEYVPYKGRMSVFWKTKWLAWPTDRKESLVWGAFKMGKQAYFKFDSAGIWSVCLWSGTGGAGTMKEVKTSATKALISADAMFVEDFKPYMIKNVESDANSMVCGDTTSYKMGTTYYKKATFCNGDATEMSANGTEACAGMFDDEDSLFSRHNVKWCKGSCDWEEGESCIEADLSTDAVGKGSDYPNACVNIASRMIQYEALSHAQAGYWVSIVIVQWADLLICKTRWLSIRQQGLRNSTLNFGLFFETLLAGWLCYYSAIADGLGTRPIRFVHWMPGIPWSIMIFLYDETRKYLMRATSPEVIDLETKRVKRNAGWLELNTYY